MATAIEDVVKAVGSQVQLSSPLGRALMRLASSIAALGGGDLGDAGGSASLAERTYRQDGDLVVAAAGSADVFALQPLLITTTQPNQKVLLTFTADRENASPTGSGQYQFVIDGALVGFVKESVGDVRETISITDLFTIATPGVHTINMRAAAVTGDETVSDFAILTGLLTR